MVVARRRGEKMKGEPVPSLFKISPEKLTLQPNEACVFTVVGICAEQGDIQVPFPFGCMFLF